MREEIKINNAQACMFQKIMIIIQGKNVSLVCITGNYFTKMMSFLYVLQSASNFILKALATMSGRSSNF